MKHLKTFDKINEELNNPIRIRLDENSLEHILKALVRGEEATIASSSNGEEYQVKMILADIGYDRIKKVLNNIIDEL
jgi:hypothetical protein